MSELALEDQAPRGGHPYRMKDLCELTGLPRQAIHFYIQQGLLPQGKKTGRNMAWYGTEHVARLKLIKKLQHERFLPLKAIKALLDGRDERFTSRQRSFLQEVKQELQATLARGSDASRTLIDAQQLMEENDVDRADVERLVELGILSASFGPDGSVRVAEDDAWIIQNCGKVRAAGFSRELGFQVDDLASYVEAVDAILERDAKLLSERLADLPPVVAARMIERGMFIFQEFLVRYHASRVRDFFSTIETSGDVEDQA